MQIHHVKVLDIHALKSTYVVYSPEGLLEPSCTRQLLILQWNDCNQGERYVKEKAVLNEAINTDGLNCTGKSLCRDNAVQLRA